MNEGIKLLRVQSDISNFYLSSKADIIVDATKHRIANSLADHIIKNYNSVPMEVWCSRCKRSIIYDFEMIIISRDRLQ